MFRVSELLLEIYQRRAQALSWLPHGGTIFLSHFLSICLVLYVVLETELQVSDTLDAYTTAEPHT